MIDWLKQLRRNPVFTAFWTFFAGSLAYQLGQMLPPNGHLNFTSKGMEDMLGLAFTTAFLSTYYHFQPKPGTNPKG